MPVACSLQCDAEEKKYSGADQRRYVQFRSWAGKTNPKGMLIRDRSNVRSPLADTEEKKEQDVKDVMLECLPVLLLARASPR